MYLCICNGVSMEEFVQKTQTLSTYEKTSIESLSGLCLATKVGTSCGACLNDALGLLTKQCKGGRSSNKLNCCSAPSKSA